MIKNRISKGRRARFVFQVFAAYVFLQLSWWARLLIESASKLYKVRTDPHLLHNEETLLEAQEELRGSLAMVMGEGAIFAVLFIVGMIMVSRLLRAEEYRLDRERSFLLAVTHELKTPIASIRLAMDTVDRLDLKGEQKTEVINEARLGADKLERRIGDILEATRLNLPDALVKSQFDLADAIAEVVSEHEIRNSTYEVVFDTSEYESRNMEGDVKMWQLCFANLIENAIKYGAEDGRLEIKLRDAGRGVKIVFEDDGPGIPVKERSKVFKSFYRMERDKDVAGTGLGLHLVERIVEMHGAKIAIKSAESGGAKFVISWEK